MTPLTRAERWTRQRRWLRLSGSCGLVFVACYLAHVVLQSPGPADDSTVTVVGYLTDHYPALLISELLNGIGLIAFALFLAALAAALVQSGEDVLAATVVVGGAVFVAMGFVSTAAETALLHVASAGKPAAVVVLFEFQSRVPVVFAATIVFGATALTVLKTRLLPRWVGFTALAATVIFLIGAVLSLLGPATGESLPVGPALFLAWMLLLSIGLLRGNSLQPAGPSAQDPPRRQATHQ